MRGSPQAGLGIAVRQPVWQVLRKHEMDAVVDRDHRTARHQRWKHVVRGVEQIDGVPEKPGRDAELLPD